MKAKETASQAASLHAPSNDASSICSAQLGHGRQKERGKRNPIDCKRDRDFLRRLGRRVLRAALGGLLLALVLGLLGTLGLELVVSSKFLTRALAALDLEAGGSALALQALGGHQSLDLRHLDRGLLALSARNLTLYTVSLLEMILLVEGEELADAGSTLRTEAAGNVAVGESWELSLALLDNHKVKNLDVGRHNAAANGLALALSLPTRAVAGGTLLKQEADALRRHDTLLHRETLLVIATRDLENISLELFAENITNNLLVHSLVEELTPENISQTVQSELENRSRRSHKQAINSFTYNLRSSSISMTFWQPVAGFDTLNCKQIYVSRVSTKVQELKTALTNF